MTTSRHRSNKAELNARIDMLLQLKAKGLSYTQLVKIAQQKWEISERHAKDYLRQVKQRERQLTQQPDDVAAGFSISRAQIIYAEALQSGDLKSSLKAVELEEKIRERNTRQGKKAHAKNAISHTSIIEENQELDSLIQFLESEGETENPG